MSLVEAPAQRSRLGSSADRVGLGALLIATVCLVAIGGKWVSGPLSLVVVLVLLAVIASVIILAWR
ncbi:MAG: hypothetical protein ACKOFZ_09165, partial [Ilumatobacteraceae bacterium]